MSALIHTARGLEDLWRSVCGERGGDFLRSPNLVGMRVPGQHGTVTLRVVWNDGNPSQELRAPFTNHRGVHFDLRPQRPTSLIGRLLFGLRQDVRAGEATFDGAFELASDTPVLAQELFSDDELRSLFIRLPSLSLSIRRDRATMGYPPGVDELYSFGGPFVGRSALDAGLDLADVLLERLALMARVGDPVRDHVRVLAGPPGAFFSGAAAWDGRPARRLAAEALGASGDARAVRPLIRALDDADPVLRAKVCVALGSLGDGRAIPALVRLLGERDEGLARSLAEEAADALRALGEGEMVDAFHAVLAGDSEPIRRHGEHSEGLSAAMIAALDGPGRAVQGHIFSVLAELGAVEALPILRVRLDSIQIPALAESCRQAIAALEALRTLPRPAEPGGASGTTLPRPSDPRDREP